MKKLNKSIISISGCDTRGGKICYIKKEITKVFGNFDFKTNNLCIAGGFYLSMFSLYSW